MNNNHTNTPTNSTSTWAAPNVAATSVAPASGEGRRPATRKQRIFARAIDQAIAAFGVLAVARVSLSTVDQRAFAQRLSIDTCGYDANTTDLGKILRSCLDDPSAGHATRYLIGQLPSSTLLLFVAGIAAVLLWQWPLVQRGASFGQRCLDLRHAVGLDRNRILGVLAWRQAAVFAPLLLFVMGMPGWPAVGVFLALQSEAFITGDRSTITDRLVGPIDEAAHFVHPTIAANWAPPSV